MGKNVGTQKQEDVNSFVIKQAAEVALDQYNQQSNSPNLHKLHEIEEATSQVVAGVVYRLKLKLAPTDAFKNQSEPNLETAKPDLGKLHTVNAEIHQRPGSNLAQVTFN